ncbi:hypothetical protein [Amycolatopsis sp. CA-230715]|uniref:hypothetical protein n=1 Tax=Amycolatopsis sp. CA-230715 TaxID=2745196 RepID=UPI001C023A58|nr:hypothetical protein [Amycolatopsis sp. CA-230715]QWF83932.1 hypothetical protein HUW46_07375 [Amycolatopsis sp. CA-230715]
MRKIIRRVGGAVAATAVAGGVTVAAALPAQASEVTPIYGMTCDKGYTSSYQAWAVCWAPGPAKWKLRVDCSFGGTYDTIWYYPPEKEWFRVDHPTSCNFGVNGVYIVEGT